MPERAGVEICHLAEFCMVAYDMLLGKTGIISIIIFKSVYKSIFFKWYHLCVCVMACVMYLACIQ